MQFLNGSQKIAVNCNEQHLLVESVTEMQLCSAKIFQDLLRCRWTRCNHGDCRKFSVPRRTISCSNRTFKLVVVQTLYRSKNFSRNFVRIIKQKTDWTLLLCFFQKWRHRHTYCLKHHELSSRKLKDCLWQK